MMKSAVLSSVTLAFLVTLTHAAAAQDLASQLPGVCKRTSQVLKELATGATSKPYGENPGGPAFFTRGGHFAWSITGDGRQAPAGPLPNEAETIALYNSMAFGTGTYRVEGSSVFLKYDSSWNQAWTGTERKAEMKVTGRTLTWTSPPFKIAGGKDAIAIITMERME